jgi:hypothetical protein
MLSKQSLLLIFICILTFFAIPNLVLADPGSDPTKPAAEKKDPSAPVLEPPSTSKFAGLNLGIGLSLTIDIGFKGRVKSASVVNGVVRVDSENNDVPRVLLETHYFFLPGKDIWGVKQGNWGVGPFLAIQSGSDNVIQSYGMGVMLGFKRTSDKDSSSSFNIGLGAMCDPNVQVLGDGIEENQPLPAGETAVRYKTTSKWGVVLLTSFSF